jgi:peptidoglycan/LPS O-acetylase OafA/YrhL
MAIVIGAIMFALLEPLKGLYWLGGRFMVWMGDISFGIYLWHFPLLLLLHRSILKQWDTPLLSIVALLITLAGTLLLASLSYYCVEKPIMQRK